MTSQSALKQLGWLAFIGGICPKLPKIAKRTTLVLSACGSLLLGSSIPTSIAGSSMPQNDRPQQDCNAFDKWARIQRAQLPKSPAELELFLLEGQRLPEGNKRLELEKWCQQMVPVADLVDEGCRCSMYADPLDKSGKVNLDAMHDVNVILPSVERFRQVRVKQLLADGKYSEVKPQIEKIFDIARPGNGGSRVLISYLFYRSAIGRGLRSIRETLYWRDLPASVLNGLPALLDDFENRSAAAQMIYAECDKFLVPSIIDESKAPDFADEVAKSRWDNPLTARTLSEILHKHSADFDPQNTAELMHQIAADAAANVDKSPTERTTPTLNKLEQELGPLAKPSPSAMDRITMPALPARLAGIHNLIGKVAAWNAVTRSSTVVPLPKLPAELADRLMMQLQATRLLIALNLFERSNHKLPDTLDKLVTDKLIVEIHPETWQGYKLEYSPSARVLKFVAVGNDRTRIEAAEKELSWKIPKPEMSKPPGEARRERSERAQVSS